MSDIDTGALEEAWGLFCATLPSESWSNDLETAAKAVTREIGWLECDENHCEDHPEYDRAASRYVREVLDKIRLGVYDENLHGSLKDVLETIERRLGE